VLTFNTANQDFYEKTGSSFTNDDQTWLFLVKPLSSQTLHSNASAIFCIENLSNGHLIRFSGGRSGYFQGRFLISKPGTWFLNNLWLGGTGNKGGAWNLIESVDPDQKI
jgi:hypothetical protein